MQLDLIIDQEDFSDEIPLIGLSAGINSAAVLVWLSQYPDNLKPKTLHLFYAHMKEHSPDSFKFVKELVRYARLHFNKVYFKMTRNSVIDFFEQQKMIPHPTLSPCTRILKILPMHEYMFNNGINLDLVGYIREEAKRRTNRMAKKTKSIIKHRSVIVEGVKKHMIISDKSNEWCFQIVKNAIGWYPAIYDIKYKGKRLFTHNNCLPCKNFTKEQFELVEIYYPKYYQTAQELADRLSQFWGRKEVDFYTTFGRADDELKESPGCQICLFD